MDIKVPFQIAHGSIGKKISAHIRSYRKCDVLHTLYNTRNEKLVYIYFG